MEQGFKIVKENERAGLREGDVLTPPIYRITVPQPEMGSKAWVLDQYGIYILESDTVGVLRGVACTHTGTGSIEIMDGVVDPKTGYFPDEELRRKHLHADYFTCNGRRLYQAPGSAMGMWMLNAGFQHGLTISATGMDVSPPVLTITWDVKKIIRKEG
jgi:hypothetical protein